MKKRISNRILAALMLIVLCSAGLAVAQKNDAANVQLQAAIHKETVEGDLEQAVRMYKDIASKYKNERTVVAEALLRLAKAYEKMGRTEALKIYEQIVKDFSNTKEASAARTRLGEVARSLESGASLTKRRLWSTPVSEADLSEASMTSNGDWIVFREVRTGNLVMKRLSTGETKVLQAGVNPTGPDGQVARRPVVSPDARYVAYRWYVGGQVGGGGDFANMRASDVRVAPLEPAGKPKVLIPARTPSLYAEPVGWSNDGKSVLCEIWNADGTVQIVWVSVQDGSRKILKSLWRRRPGRPSLSPDGQYIAYSAFPTESTWPSPAGSAEPDSHIYVLRADGSQETEVVSNASINESPVWTRDGSHILFTSNRREGSFDLWSVKLGERKADGTPIPVERNVGRIFPVGVTNSGALFYANRSVEGDDIFTIDLKSSGKVGTSQVQLTENSVGANRAPSWSPDGRFIAFKRRNAGSSTKFALVVREISSGEEKTFNTTLFEMGPDAPVWFHDSQALALAGPGSAYYRLDLKAGKFAAIAQGRSPLNYSTTIAISADDKFLYAAAGGASGVLGARVAMDRIVAFDLNSKQQKDLFSVPGGIGTFALSPNGKTFAIVSANKGGGAVFSPIDGRLLVRMGAKEPVRLSVIGVDGSGQRDLYGPFFVGEAVGSDLIAWTNDSRTILFGETKPESSLVPTIMRMAIDGGRAESTGLNVPGAFHQLSLSPDNSRIAFGMTYENSWELSEISNITAAVRRSR